MHGVHFVTPCAFLWPIPLPDPGPRRGRSSGAPLARPLKSSPVSPARFQPFPRSVLFVPPCEQSAGSGWYSALLTVAKTDATIAPMPKISEWGPVSIFINTRGEHNPPHFHALSGEWEASIRIGDFAVMAGKLPPKVLGQVVEWALCTRGS